jgi:hypothetical protein
MAVLRIGSKCSHTNVYARTRDFFAEPRLALLNTLIYDIKM